MTWQTSTEKLCPLVKEKCIEHRCVFFNHVIGKHPQTGAQVDEWDCAIAWSTFFMIEQAKAIREVAGEAQAMRNDMQETGKKALLAAATYRLKELTGRDDAPDGQNALPAGH